MNVFVPYPSPLDCAKALYGDLRFNKQIVECKQILNAIDGVGRGWFNHPVVKMYKPYREWLMKYALCLQEYRNYERYYHTDCYSSGRSKGKAIIYSVEADKIRPPFLTEEFCDQHKRRLFSKNPTHYSQFAEYGTSEVNWYVINNEIVKYKDGKRIKE